MHFKRWLMLGIGLVLVTGVTSLLRASDHIDFPGDAANPSGTTGPEDLTDVFAFMNHGKLVLAMNTLASAPPDAEFSDAVQYVFRLRSANVTSSAVTTPGPAEDASEYRMDCHYLRNGVDRLRSSMECETACEGVCDGFTGRRVTVQMESLDGGVSCVLDNDRCMDDTAAGDLKLFAGLRADPFFLDAGAAAAVLLPRGEEGSPERMKRDGLRAMLGITELGDVIEGVMPAPMPRNSLAGKDVLSIVVEFDPAQVLGTTGVLAVTAETYAERPNQGADQ